MKSLKNKEKNIDIALSLLILILLILSFSILRDYKYIRDNNLNHKIHFNKNLNQTLSANDSSQIQPWLTFDYINKIFNLPSDYLKTNLNIKDSKYPKISIKKYIKDNKLNEYSFINEVRDNVIKYFNQK